MDKFTYCILRTYSAGVYAGYVDLSDVGKVMTVYNARWLWQWWSEFTLSALAVHGGKEGKEKQNRYAMPVERIILTDVVAIFPCTAKAQKYIEEKESYAEP
jgi:hypothetical protein